MAQSVQVVVHAVNLHQDNMDVVLFQKLFAVPTSFIAAQMDTHAMLQMELVAAAVTAYQCYKKCQR